MQSVDINLPASNTPSSPITIRKTAT